MSAVLLLGPFRRIIEHYNHAGWHVVEYENGGLRVYAPLSTGMRPFNLSPIGVRRLVEAFGTEEQEQKAKKRRISDLSVVGAERVIKEEDDEDEEEGVIEESEGEFEDEDEHEDEEEKAKKRRISVKEIERRLENPGSGRFLPPLWYYEEGWHYRSRGLPSAEDEDEHEDKDSDSVKDDNKGKDSVKDQGKDKGRHLESIQEIRARQPVCTCPSPYEVSETCAWHLPSIQEVRARQPVCTCSSISETCALCHPELYTPRDRTKAVFLWDSSDQDKTLWEACFSSDQEKGEDKDSVNTKNSVNVKDEDEHEDEDKEDKGSDSDHSVKNKGEDKGSDSVKDKGEDKGSDSEGEDKGSDSVKDKDKDSDPNASTGRRPWIQCFDGSHWLSDCGRWAAPRRPGGKIPVNWPKKSPEELLGPWRPWH